MKESPLQQHVEDSISHLYKAHTALSRIVMQVDALVLKAHKMSCHREFGGFDLSGFSQFLDTTACSLQEWVPRLESVTSVTDMQGRRHGQAGTSTSSQEEDRRVGGETSASKDKLWSCMESEKLLDVSESVDDNTTFMDKENVLSDSPLVPWLERAQFFVLTPIAKHKKGFTPVILRRCSLKEQESLQSLPPPSMDSPRLSCAHAQAIEAMPGSTLSLCETSAMEDDRFADHLLVSASSTPSPLHHQSYEDPGILATPLPPQSLVKRYSNFFEADEEFTDSSPLLLVTPILKLHQTPQHESETEEEGEGTEITEYFTAFTPSGSKTPEASASGRKICSFLLDKADEAHKGLPLNVQPSTPLPPQSLMKRYSEFLHPEVSSQTLTDRMMTLTPILVSSPPKTCILMRPNHKEDDAVKPPRHSLQTPLLLLKSPFRTPGLYLRKAHDLDYYEDMDLTSLKKPGQPPRPPQSARRTPSSDMQFTTVRRVPASVKRTPLVDPQLSTVRKPGAPLPGEQTLKRELWCRMEAEFTSISHVCKSLFTDSQMDASANAGAGKSGIENKENRFVPRGLQQRGLNLCM